MNIRHVLVTTDLSPEALRPCAPVGDLARALGARITLLHVVEQLGAIPHGAPLAPPITGPDVSPQIEAARAELESQRGAFGNDVPVATEVILGTDIARAVADHARSHEVDLVALSTHGRTGFRHLALGSVAEALLRLSSVPVMVFPRHRT